MHLVLQLDDIQRLIFQFVEPHDLAQLALTCKAFFGTATDERWRTIHSLMPLLSCLPPDCHSRTIRTEDFHRYDFYVPKIQNILLEYSAVPRVPQAFRHKRNASRRSNYIKSWEQLWEEIQKLRPMSESLSNLRRLRIANADERFLLPLIGIPGINLTQISFPGIENRQTLGVLFRILDGLQHTPKLESLFVRDDEIRFADLVRQSPLKYLRIEPRIRHRRKMYEGSPLSHEILRKSTLKNLTLCLTQDWYSSEIKSLHGKYLPALKRLWLNLAAFDPTPCHRSCTNISASSWTCLRNEYSFHRESAIVCRRQSPTVFLQGLDHPELSLLNIKFPNKTTTGRKFLDVVSAVNSSCRLGNLTELALAGGGWIYQRRWHDQSPPQIQPGDLRAGLTMLLPLPQLTTLRLSVAPNFLDVLDLKLYKSITSGLRRLEKLSLGHAEFCDKSEYRSDIFHERVPLHHLAAFCSMLPKLKDVSIGTVDGLTLEKRPRKEWACVGVQTLTISRHADVTRGPILELLRLGLETYFPNSGLVKHCAYRREDRWPKANSR